MPREPARNLVAKPTIRRLVASQSILFIWTVIVFLIRRILHAADDITTVPGVIDGTSESVCVCVV
jgi:hypothetical protein